MVPIRDFSQLRSIDKKTKNRDRCQQILECKSQVQFWRSKLDVLEAEQTDCIKLARLRLDAPSTWNILSSGDRLEKKFILAAMESEDLPEALEDFPGSSDFPPLIRMDKDILLARVGRKDFSGKYSDDRLFVPPKLRGDKEVIVTIIPKHPAVIECMSCELRNDSDIFLTVLKTNSTLPVYVLQHFSHRIRSDRNLMLELCAHRNGIPSMGFICTSLRNDKSFMMEAIQVSQANNDWSITTSRWETHQILRYTSQRLQDDPEVVLVAVQRSGLNLKYASLNLRRNRNIVMTAIEENGTAFRYCLPGDVKDRLLSDRSLILKHKILKNASNNTLRILCLDRFQTDPEFIAEALGYGIDWSMIPLIFQNSRDFAKNTVMRNPRSYLNPSESFRKDIDIARIAVQADGVDDCVLLEAMEQCPGLFSDREIMLTIVKSLRVDSLHEALQFSPIEVRGDKEIMLEAVKIDPTAFEFCSEELSVDRNIIFATVESSSNYLYLLTDSYQLENPDIVICAIKSSNSTDLLSLYENICEEMWSNRYVGLAWLSKGGDWLDDDFPDDFKDNEELCLTLAKHNWTDFENASVALRSDREFMLNAVMVDARVIRDIIDTDDQLRYDYDLTLLAFSRDKRTIQFYSSANDFEYMVAFTEKVRKRIEDYDTFNDVVLASIIRQPQNSSLSLLNQGPYAIRYHSNLISSYLGVPDREEVQMLREASINLLHWGF